MQVKMKTESGRSTDSTIPGSRRTSLGQNETTDLSLLQKIAFSQDHDAFEELYRRIAIPSYNLALYLCGSRHLAEEAVQDAMVRVWRYAKSCRDENPRAWIMKIVANQTIKITEQQRNRNMSIEIDEITEGMTAIRNPVGADIEKEEVHEAVRKCLEAFPIVTRQIVALYYGAELKQADIAKFLKLPQTTVSMKLRNALSDLRSDLTMAGFASAGPLLGSGTLRGAILGGQSAPPGLWHKISAQLDSAGKVSVRMDVTAVGGKVLGLGGVILLVGACFYLAATRNWSLGNVDSSEKVAHSISYPESPQSLKSAGDQSSSKKNRLIARWDFRQGPIEGINATTGRWTWRPVHEGLPAGMNSEGETTIQLPVETPKQPFRVEMQVAMLDVKGLSVASSGWPDSCRIWSRDIVTPQRRYTTDSYFISNHVIMSFQGRIWSVRKYEKPFPSSQLFVGLTNIVVEEISVHSLDSTEIPFKEPETLIQELLNDPARFMPKPGTVPGDENRKFRPR